MRVFLMAAAMLCAGTARAATCENLASLKLPNATRTLAQEVPAAANTPAYCRVAATPRTSHSNPTLGAILEFRYRSRSMASLWLRLSGGDSQPP